MIPRPRVDFQAQIDEPGEGCNYRHIRHVGGSYSCLYFLDFEKGWAGDLKALGCEHITLCDGIHPNIIADLKYMLCQGQGDGQVSSPSEGCDA